jgi:hypothetical protein
MTTLPTLYKRTKTGAIQVCSILVSADTYTVVFGKLNGKMQSKTTTCKPKNVGKSNETTGPQQAILEAESKYRSKIDEGYSLNQEPDSEVELPMKVKIYQESKHLVDWQGGVTVSPKLNGVNGEFKFKLVNGKLKLFSRGGLEYPMLEHLKPTILKVLQLSGETSLNVELYKHGWHLQDITAAVKAFKPDTHEFPTSKIEAHIFEVPSRTNSYVHTMTKIAAITSAINKANIKQKLPILVDTVPFYEVTNEAEIDTWFDRVVDNFEGLIVRNNRCEYRYNERSSDVFKYKKALDAEYEIVGYNIDKNDHVVYVCTTKNGKRFSVKRKGTNEQRLADALVVKTNIGKFLTIEYETLSKDLIPQKPVGLNFRDCDINGDPLI